MCWNFFTSGSVCARAINLHDGGKRLPPIFCQEPDSGWCVAQAKLGEFAMPSAAYFRRQADVCLRLSLIASDDAISTKLVTMAKDYLATSEALDKQPETSLYDLLGQDTARADS
jgi:hypothetical protein